MSDTFSRAQSMLSRNHGVRRDAYELNAITAAVRANMQRSVSQQAAAQSSAGITIASDRKVVRHG